MTLKRSVYNSIVNGAPLILFVVLLMSFSVSVAPQRATTHLSSFLICAVKTIWLGVAFALLSFSKRWLRYLWFFLSLLVSEIYLYLGLRFSVSFTPYVAQLILQTSQQEALEFFGSYFTVKFTAFLCIAFIGWTLLYWLAETLWQKFLKHRSGSVEKHKKGVAVILIVISLVSLFSNMSVIKSIDFGTREANYDKDVFCIVKPPYTEIYESFDSGKDNTDIMTLVKEGYDALTIDSCAYTSPHIVLVIGESFIKSHSNLYGYRLNTNPTLSEEKEKGNLFVFNDVLSKYMVTKESVGAMLKVEDDEMIDSIGKITLLPSAFKKAGYKVSVMDNQAVSVCNEWEFSLLFLINQPSVKNWCIDYRNERPCQFDNDLVLAERSRERSQLQYPTLSIYHLQGQHEDSYWRCPQTADFQYFTVDSIKREVPDKKDIVNYDNATRYNDYVISQIIETYRDEDAIIIYTSDHGDSMYDDDDLTFGRGLKPELTDQQIKLYYEVPFFIWCSDKYISNHPDIIARIHSSVDNPYQTSDIAHMLFDLAGIKSNVYDETRSLISQDFRFRPRKLSNQTYIFEYDDMRERLDTLFLKSRLN